MKANDIRRSFLDFFAARGHRILRSSSLVPAADPTLLFTNAGMNQFKDVFLGLERRDYNRATTSQKCLRVSGKHNDLENVGRTTRHHTFFEMLGNFSFGDYFKREAIQFAWELMVDVYKLDPARLYPTVFREDDEAFSIWERDIGVPTSRIFRLGEEDNFWAMGETGPCGPCSELQYDFGPEASDLGHQDCQFPCECGRYVELWNLVFMQFNRDASGKQTLLPKPSVDTGAGLERLAAALQGKLSNYDTDLFYPLIEHAAEMADKDYGDDPRADTALRVIADHSRAAAFVVGDGVLPSNEGRGYVLRKIVRRAIDYGRQIGLDKPFLFEMAGRVAELMREPYPELLESLQRISTVIKAEEEKYSRLVEPGLANLEKFMRERKSEAVGAEELFYAYGTLGLRPDFIDDWAQSRGLRVAPDAAKGMQRLLDEERERAKASWKGVGKEVASPIYQELARKHPTVFDGYTQTTSRDCRIVAIVTKEGAVKELPPGAEGEIVLDHTPFYAESGGQIGDTGKLFDPEGNLEVADVLTCYHPLMAINAHKVRARERLAVGDRVLAVVDAEARHATMRNHTGTHLLHAALRRVLGPHVKQSGSLVAPDRLRFDFTHYAALDPEELEEIERQVNEQILRDNPVTEERMDLDAALRSGALAFFGDKYPEKNVRVITIPDPAEESGFFSKELCGGTHVRHTGQIGVLKVVSESSSAAGIRRVEAITGARALESYQQALESLRRVATTLRVSEAEVVEAVDRLTQHTKQLEKQLQAAKERSARSQVDDLVEQVRRVKDVGVLSAQVQDIDTATLRALVDTLRQKLGSGVVALGTTTNGKVALIVGVTKDLTSRLHAGKIVKEVAQRVGGSGGGRPDLAEAGGKDPAQLQQALEDVYRIVEKML
ncbi:MAG TPA: alanine--tRNA ligase [Candidatus Xenobia bacterium]|nr:alanine--tRNA ligase [Candidatus Xenobia bacterium]